MVIILFHYCFKSINAESKSAKSKAKPVFSILSREALIPVVSKILFFPNINRSKNAGVLGMKKGFFRLFASDWEK